MTEKKTFWTSLPGVLTALAAIISAIGGLLIALHSVGILGTDTTGSDSSGARSQVAARNNGVSSVVAKSPPKTAASDVSERQELTLLEEYFRNNLRGWPVFDNNDCWSKVDKGVYVIKAKQMERSQSLLIKFNIDATDDFIIKSTIRKTSGPNNHGYGIEWGSAGPQNHYRVEISGSGFFQYGKAVNNSFHPIIGWTKTSAIKTGNSSNTITVMKRNDILEFQVNGQFIRATPFEPFFGKKIGFIVNETIAVEVENIRITGLL